MEQSEGLLTSTEAARVLGIGRKTLAKLEGMGEGPPVIRYTETGWRLYRRSDLEQYMQARTLAG